MMSRRMVQMPSASGVRLACLECLGKHSNIARDATARRGSDREPNSGVSIRRLLLRAQADTKDALNVLEAGGRSKGVQTALKRALKAAGEAADRNNARGSDPIIVSRVMKISALLLRTAQQLICRDGDIMFCR